MKVSSKLMTVVLTAAFVLSLVGSTQAALPGFLIAGMDHRTQDSNKTLKAFDLDGTLQWEVDADEGGGLAKKRTSNETSRCRL